jgi:DNA gyrase/topoisomerase IV subunit B
VDKENPFILDKIQYIDVFEKRISNVIKIIDTDTNIVFSKNDVREFLLLNREYIRELYRLASHFAIDPLLLEFILIHENDSDFITKLKTKYPEMTIDSENVISGIHENKYQNLIIDKIFYKRTNNFKSLINSNKKKYYEIHEIINNTSFNRGIMSIGGFLSFCEKYQPPIVKRFKGLGELEPKDLRNTTLDPNNRILIQLTMEDVEKEIEKFKTLHDDNCRAERKKMMANIKIKMEDLDN